MCLLLITLTLLPLLSTAVPTPTPTPNLLTLPSQSSSTSNWTIYNSPISAISGTTTAVPYQYVEMLDSANNILRMKYNFSGGSFPQGSIEAVSTLPDFRVDGYEDLKIELSINLTSGTLQNYITGSTTAYDSSISVQYVTPTLPIIFQVYYWKSSPTVCSSSTVNISGVKYGLKSVSATNFILQRCAPSPNQLNALIDLTELNQYVMSVGSLAVEPWSNRTGLKVKTRVQGAGEIILQHKAYRLERMQYVVRLSVMGTNFAIINEPIYPDWSRGDFVNLSLPVNGSAEGIISHIYLNQSSVTSLHGANWILLGTYYRQWKTPIHTHGLPVSIGSLANMYVNISFTASAPSVPTGRCACVILNFRDDFDPISEAFSMPTDYISRKVTIFFWASQIYRNKYEVSSPNYISYAGTNWKVAFQFGKEYNFWAQTSLDRLTNFNLFAFLRYLRDNTVFFVEGDYLIGIQTGFRYITGESKIIVNEFNLEQTDRNYTNSDEKTIIIILQQPTNISCSILTDDESFCKKAEETSVAIANFLSVPVIGVLMRFSPLISLVDEYTFYIYHRVNYDKGFLFIVNLCSNWTDSKWVPSFLQNFSNWLDNISEAVTDTSIDGQTVRSPSKFSEFGKYNNFYKNISVFLVITLPLNLITFALLAGLSWALRRLAIFRWLQIVLRPFRSFLNLWSSVVIDNMTYLSFHCFLQLYRFVPYSHGANNFPSCLFCLITLFAILLTLFVGLPAKLFAKKYFEIDYCQQQNCLSYFLFGAAAMGRFATGFFHAYADDPEMRALGLFVVNSCVVLALVFCRNALQFKAYFCFYFGVYLSKAILNLQLFMEIGPLPIKKEIQLFITENSLLLVLLVFGSMLILNMLSKIKAIYYELKVSSIRVPDDVFASKSEYREKQTIMQSSDSNKTRFTQRKQVDLKDSVTVRKRRKGNRVNKFKNKESPYPIKKISEELILNHKKIDHNKGNKNSDRQSHQQIKVVCIRREQFGKGKACFKGALQLKLIAPRFQF